jgi:hypothetical protein
MEMNFYPGHFQKGIKLLGGKRERERAGGCGRGRKGGRNKHAT